MEFSELLLNKAMAGNQQLIEQIKMLLYKTDPNIFDRINFDDDHIFQEPLLFSYFNSSESERGDINAILLGYTEPALRQVSVNIETDGFGRYYLPNIGWVTGLRPNHAYTLQAENEQIIVLDNKNIVAHSIAEKQYVSDDIELLYYPVQILDQYYYDVSKNRVAVEITEITQLKRSAMEEAFALIKKYCSKHYQLMQSILKKCVIFNVNYVLRNSFATLEAHGICFCNAYQEDYGVVFFVDDIAHQSGHNIFYAVCNEPNKLFVIDYAESIQTVERNGKKEHRSVYILLHALYTYYTTFLCLDACLKAGAFNGIERYEALGRVHFYLNKCHSDMYLIDSYSRNGIAGAQAMFSEEGMEIYAAIKEEFKHILDTWGETVKDWDMSNQLYNFTFSRFLALNPYI